MLPLPDSPTDPLKLADWLELLALTSPDGNSSRGDLERALHAAGLVDLPSDEAIEEKVISVMSELQDRAKAAGEAYPFETEAGLLCAETNWEEFPSYVFCLCLSYFGCKERKGSKAYPRRWFEHLSRDALKDYIGGCAIRFGSPRSKKEVPVKFKDAIKFICMAMKEGEDFKNAGLPHRQDDAVDIIAWKQFADELPGKLIAFGNCATERDWEGSKRTELQPEAFCSDWMTEPPPCKIVKTFFVPHRIERRRLSPNIRRTGIIFDRCRISYLTRRGGAASQQTDNGTLFDYSLVARWSRKTLDKARS